MNHYLGIDTSAYTTSLAIVNDDFELIWEERKVLDVPEGERGLAQSAALFQHIQNLPHLVSNIPKELWDKIAGVGVSTRPRPIEGSYMPVFTAGYGVAVAIANALQVPMLETSHQEGHLAAGIASAKDFNHKEFLAIHISGGTTELLLAKHICKGKFEINILGGTTDLHAGQFIDRVGVYLGLPFPAGKHLEELAKDANPEAASWLPSSVRGFEVSFSGVETAARRLVDQGKSKADIARAVEGCIARTMTKLVKTGSEKTNLNHVLVVGGVASNNYIRTELDKRLGKFTNFYWAKNKWSSDNAIGVAVLTCEKYKKG